MPQAAKKKKIIKTIFIFCVNVSEQDYVNFLIILQTPLVSLKKNA